MKKAVLLLFFSLCSLLGQSQQLESDELRYLDLSGDTIEHYLHQFIEVFDSIQGQPLEKSIIVLRVNQILDAKIYEIESAFHEFGFMEGNYDEIKNDFDSVAPPFFYSYVKERLVLIYTGAEHLSPSRERFYKTLDLTDKYVPRFVPQEQEEKEWIQILPPPTGGLSIWRVINCRGEIKLVKLDSNRFSTAQDDGLYDCKAVEPVFEKE